MVSTDVIQQQSATEFEQTREKKLTNLNSDKSLQGLVIDWHLANTEMGFDNFVEPILDFQPTYAYAQVLGLFNTRA